MAKRDRETDTKSSAPEHTQPPAKKKSKKGKDRSTKKSDSKPKGSSKKSDGGKHKKGGKGGKDGKDVKVEGGDKPKTFAKKNGGGKKAPVALTKEDRKRIRKERQAAKPNADIVQKAKVLWEASFQELGPKERQSKVSKILEPMYGKLVELSQNHVTARVLGICIKHAERSDLMKIYAEFKGNFVALSRNDYGRFVVRKFLAQLTNGHLIKRDVPVHEEFYGQIQKLLLYKNSAIVVDYLYRECCSKSQRLALLQEFFHPTALRPTFAQFMDGVAQKRKAPSSTPAHFPRSLRDVLAPARAEGEEAATSSSAESESITSTTSHAHRSLVLSQLKQFVSKVFEKEMVTPLIFHDLVYEYLTTCVEADETELIESICSSKDLVLSFLQTKVGTHIVIHCISYTTAKFRKHFVRAFQGHVADMARDPHGWRVLARCLGVIDDTVMLNKIIGAELKNALAAESDASADDQKPKNVDDFAEIKTSKAAEAFLANANVCKLFLHVLASTRGRYFAGVDDREFLPPPVTQGKKDAETEGKEVAETPRQRPTSRKDAGVRRKELLNSLIAPLTSSCVDQVDELIGTVDGAGLLVEVSLEGFRRSLPETNALSDALAALLRTKSEILDGPAHRAVKRLVVECDAISTDDTTKSEGDAPREHFLRELNSVFCGQQSDDMSDVEANLESFTKTRATFVMVALLKQTTAKDVSKELRGALKPYKKQLKLDHRAGAQALCEALSASKKSKK